MRRYRLGFTFVLLILVAGIASFSYGVIVGKDQLFPYKHMKQAYDWSRSLEVFQWLRKVQVEWQNKEWHQLGSALHGLEFRTTDIVSTLASARFRGGGIYAIGNQLIGASARGEFFLLDRENEGVAIKKIDIDLESNLDSFLDYLNDRKMNSERALNNFRVTDIVVVEQEGRNFLIASHVYWHELEECYTLRLSRLVLEESEHLETISRTAWDWDSVWESAPCLKTALRIKQFSTHQSGGRMLVTSTGDLLLAVGDFGFDGVRSELNLPQDQTSDYGKVLKIDPNTGESEVVSIGHRNPQGLAQDRSGRIWVTEHGPQGGDELNLIEAGGNYGWPLVTHGTHYGTETWPLSSTQGRHAGFRRPVYAWIPSIGVSNLIEVRGFLTEWDGDLLVASLRRMALIRLRFIEGRIIFAEPIEIGKRIRDLDQLEDGTIVMLADNGTIIELRASAQTGPPESEWMPPDLDQSQREEVLAVVTSCLECHSVSPLGPQEGSPNLFGIYGKQIAASTYSHYSGSLKRNQGVWDYDSLDAFLHDGEAFAPDNVMRYPKIEDDKVRHAVIRYLQSLDK